MTALQTPSHHPRLSAWLLFGALLAGIAFAAEPDIALPPRSFADTVGITPTHMTADYWIARTRQDNRLIFDRAGIATLNNAMREVEPSLHDIENLPDMLETDQVTGWIEAISREPTRTLYDESGKEGSSRAISRLVDALDLRRVPPTQVTRYGMVVRRADLRAFPTHLRVFHSPDDQDIDRFQESALFPGTPVAVVHESRDKRWLFVISETYAAWIEKDAIAFGTKQEIFAYTRKSPFLVVTGAVEHTVHTRDNPRVSAVQLEMGTRLPLLADWPADEPVNGQHPLFGHVVELPVRNENGTLSFSPALLPRSADVSDDYLPLTRANLLRQAFKFLGERYGWGHSYNARDCSGFVSEIYRSFGILLPRNTSRQSVTPALNRIEVTADTGHDERLKLLKETQIGDLIFIPGHVMMVVGQDKGETWVIHDTAGMSWMRDDGSVARAQLNGVVVTPVTPMLSSATEATIDRITNIQRVRR